MQLVVGYRSASDVLNDPTVQPHSTRFDFRLWLDILFPKGAPYTWVTDEF